VRNQKAAVQAFYDDAGWRWSEEAGSFADGAAFDDLRPFASAYRKRANERVREALPAAGDLILDAASGAIQYEDYARFSEGYKRRVCVDLSLLGLRAARRRIGEHGLFVRADVTALPFAPGAFDAVVSLHTLYHVPAEEQATFLREIARVLRSGRRAVVVSAWQSSPWDLALRVPGALARRSGAALRKLGRLFAAAPAVPASSPAKAADLYFHPTRRAWLRSAVPSGLSLAVRCWRSVSVDFLRGLSDSDRSLWLLARLARIEDAWPGWAGWSGVYPLLVFDKASPGDSPPA
jgi:ubiquinone/menaquinone biosynthesis C-methylase UbiE